MKKFLLKDTFKGYQAKKDITNIYPPNVNYAVLVVGSHDVLINDADKVSSRAGYTLDGSANPALTPIHASYEWQTSTGVERAMRVYDDALQVRYNSDWMTILTGFTTASYFQFTTWWDATEVKDLLLFVNGDANIRMWSGGITTYASSTAAAVAEAGDAANQMSSWVITGATASNTNAFVLYWKLTDVAGTRTVNIYKDSAGASLVATGSRAGDGSVTLTASGGSGLTGSVIVTYTADDTTVSANTLTLTYTLSKQGTTTWAEERFLIGGTRQFVANGVTYTYTGGEGTTTLTGITPDPAAGSLTAGMVIYQAVRVSSNQPYALAKNDLIEMHKNQIYVGSLTRRDVYVSKNTSYTDYTFTANRLPGEGAILTLDSNIVGFVPQEDAMYISAGKSDWYQSVFTLSSDNTKEAMTIQKLKNGPKQGAYSQGLIGKNKNSIVFVSQEPTFDIFGRIENINTPQAVPLSDPIKDDFGSYDFTHGHVVFWKNNNYIALPNSNRLLIYDNEREYWQPPQILPAGRLAIIGGELYLHSNSVPETYKLFTGLSDNDNVINSKAVFAYENYDHRAWQKNFDEWFTEGYISQNTTLSLTLDYNFEGITTSRVFDIEGSDADIAAGNVIDNSLGKFSIGKQPLGSTTEDGTDLHKFRVINTTKRQDFYELKMTYESSGDDVSWELLAMGGNIALSSADNISIKT